MSTVALAENLQFNWHNRLADMLQISRLSTKAELDVAYKKEIGQMNAAKPRNEYERALLAQKREELDRAYMGCESQNGADINTALLTEAYDDAASARPMQFFAIPYVLWLLSRILNCPSNWIHDCTKCSCCNDNESCICFCTEDCIKDTYDGSSFLKVLDTILFFASIIIGGIYLIRRAQPKIENWRKRREIRRKAALHAEQLDDLDEYLDSLNKLATRYNELMKDYTGMTNPLGFIESVSGFLDDVGRIKTNESLDAEYDRKCDKIKEDYLRFRKDEIQRMCQDVITVYNKRPDFSELTNSEKFELGKFEKMISNCRLFSGMSR